MHFLNLVQGKSTNNCFTEFKHGCTDINNLKAITFQKQQLMTTHKT